MFSDPAKNIEQFGLQPGMTVADFGAGSGAYTLAAAHAVGQSGRVIAIEVQKELVSRIDSMARSQGVRNVEVIWGDVERLGGSKLAESSIDAGIAANLLFQIEDKHGFINELKRVLKPGGRMLIVDWQDSFGGTGPRPEDIVFPDIVRELFEANGLVYERSIEAGEHHWGIIVRHP